MYANFVELESLMLYAKFQDHGTSGSLLIFYLLPHKKALKVFTFTTYGCGGHLGHVTWTIYKKTSVPSTQGCFMRSLTMNGQVVS